MASTNTVFAMDSDTANETACHHFIFHSVIAGIEAAGAIPVSVISTNDQLSESLARTCISLEEGGTATYHSSVGTDGHHYSIVSGILSVAIPAAYVVADLATGRIDVEEACSKMQCSLFIGAGVSVVVKTAETYCPKACSYLASKGFVIMATCCRNALPLVGSAFALCKAASSIRAACANDANSEATKEAWASSIEATAVVACTVAVLALECSGPVGWAIIAILGAGVVAGFCIRTFW